MPARTLQRWNKKRCFQANMEVPLSLAVDDSNMQTDNTIECDTDNDPILLTARYSCDVEIPSSTDSSDTDGSLSDASLHD